MSRSFPWPRLHRRRRGRTPSRRRRVVLGVALLLVSAASAVGVNVVLPSATNSAAAATGSTCSVGTSDGSGGCVATLPCPPSPVVCNPATPPTVDVGPVAFLQDGQYVSVKATNFPNSGFADGAPGGAVRVALCSTKSPDPADPNCLFGTWESQVFAQIPNEQVNTTTSDDLTEVQLPVFLEPQGNGVPIPGQPVTGPFSGPSQGFYCDDSDSPCAIEVTWEEQRDGLGDNGNPGQTADPYDTSANTVVMPLSFAAQAAACPSTDPVFSSESSYAFQHFVDAAIGATCQQSNGVIDFDTGTDTLLATQDFASGDKPLAFVDNPADPKQEAALLGGRSFAYIPIAISATTVGFLGDNQEQQEEHNQLGQPIQSYDITPTMLAGILNGDYQVPLGSYSGPGKLVKGGVFYSDNLLAALAAAGVSCTQIVGCTPPPGKNFKAEQLLDEENMNAFNLLNPVPSTVESLATEAVPMGSYAPIAASGTAWQATSWICQQPAEPMTVQLPEVGPGGSTVVTPVAVTDTNPSPTELADTPHNGPLASINPITGLPYWQWPTADCSSQSTLPPAPVASCIPGSCPIPNLAQYTLPGQQTNELREFVYGVSGFNSPNLYPPPEQYGLGFALLDSSDAMFYGLNLAGLLNSSGQFVTPTTTSVEDALENETACPQDDLSCPQGTYAFDYAQNSTPDAAGAYPMPDITYALVPTSPQDPSQAAAMKDLLTNLLDISRGDGATPLPPGFYPMPTTMYDAAIAAVDSDIVAGPSSASSTTTPTTATTPGPSASPTGSSQAGTGPDGGSSPGGVESAGGGTLGQGLPITSSTPSSSPSRTSSPSRSSSSGGSPDAGPASPAAFSLVSADSASRWLLPTLVLLSGLSLIGGAVLLVGPGARRRRRLGNGP